MERERPVEEAIYENDVDKFGVKLAKLGFTFAPIGKPQTLVLETDVSDSPRLELLTKDSRAAIDSFLTEREADGGLILHLEARRRIGGALLRVTLLPYRLIPTHESA